jgi:FkbM family methyltransferase
VGITTLGKRLVKGGFARAGYDIRRRSVDGRGPRRGLILQTRGVDLILDVGANVGQYATEVRECGYAGDLISIEPLSAAFTQLAAKSARDPRWQVLRSCVGAEQGRLTLHVSGNSQSSSVLPMLDRHANAAPASRYVAEEVVDVQPLDVLVGEAVEAHQAPYLKVDTQGFEHEVLRGAPKILERVVGVELELSLVPLYEGQTLMADLVRQMTDAGFRLASLEKGFWDPITGESLQMDGIFLRD